VDDLTQWRYEGVIYEAKQDPNARDGCEDLYAPDVVRGNDGRYYLYYTLSGPGGEGFNTPFSVAVCDSPAGKYRYLGIVKNPDGSPFLTYITGDPGLLNDNGVIRLYYGWSLSGVAGAAYGRGEADHEAKDLSRQELLAAEKMLFKRSEEELLALPHDLMGANTVTLADDMLTVHSMPERIVPGQFNALGSGFEGHAFYEAASIRKIDRTYYFIYSSQESHELCYATSRYPDRDFVYRGIIISNGDVEYQGRKPEDRLNMTGNNHGSIECVNGKWYIFYHRQTHNSTYSRQACAESVEILPDGSIPQVEITSCGLNGGPLVPEGEYPAAIACNITNGCMPHATNRIVNADIPYITHGVNPVTGKTERYITNIKTGTMIGFKYFAFEKPVTMIVQLRGNGGGVFEVSADSTLVGNIPTSLSEDWKDYPVQIDTDGTKALYLVWKGEGKMDFLSFNFKYTEAIK
jgi:hypothetical protein